MKDMAVQRGPLRCIMLLPHQGNWRMERRQKIGRGANAEKMQKQHRNSGV